MNDEFDVVGYDLKPGAPKDEISDALVLAEHACKPAEAVQIVPELMRLNSVTQTRERGETDLEMNYVAMAEGLSEFPIDVIRDACRAYARCHKWRPSLSELREFCWPRFRARDSLRSVLRKAVA